MLQAGASYHVFARANRKEMILNAKDIKDLLLSVIKQAKGKYDFRLENICIMENHFHLIIRPGVDECLSTIMQWILGVFAMRYNRRKGLTGHVWGERFKSVILSSINQYWEKYVYVDDNPRKAGLVKRAEDWLYGRFHLNRIGCDGLLSRPSYG